MSLEAGAALATARAVLEDYGAQLWAARARQTGEQQDSSSSKPAASPRIQSTATFRCDGDTRTITFADQSVLMRDLKGFRYIERLLADPSREFHVLDLVAHESGSPAVRAVDAGTDGMTVGFGGGLAIIDDEAREAYGRRLAEVDADIEDATSLNDGVASSWPNATGNI